jgi:nucleotide-binding universal stress UspA family protein
MLADLTVFAVHADSDDHMSVIEATLLGSGRPILMVPQAWNRPIGERIAIAWNGRREAALALGASLELLERASGVDLLTAETASTSFERGEAVADYLGLQGITCERHALTAGEHGVGDALLKHAGELGSDLLVMGGYGRSRLSELVLGGVTRHVLAHATLPILLVH